MNEHVERRDPAQRPAVAVIGGGPAGLMAAEVLSRAGAAVTVHERMPSVGRKLLMAGRGGLNLTHAEPLPQFLARYGAARPWLKPAIDAFPPAALRAWADGLGQETFVGSSGRVFPKPLKASPLLRAWLARLSAQDVGFAPRRDWTGWDAAGRLVFRLRDGNCETLAPDATVLALGGASWPRLGANGAWVGPLAAAGVAIRPLRPANCGFHVAWSETFRSRFAGEPLKRIALSFADRTVLGEAMVTGYGLEGGAVYALSAALRDAIERDGRAVLRVDLRPDLGEAALARRLARPQPGQSMASVLRKAAGLPPVAASLLREAAGLALPREPERLAALIKAAPLLLTAPQSLERAISTAGGVALEALDERLMLRARPGVFVAGEMLDWEAPTGGYLLQAVLATGVAAANGVLAWLGRPEAAG
jgi:uncharacterized flavoprotein (TIGR03862 family)